MKLLLKLSLMISFFLFAASSGFAQDNSWEQAFVQALQNGKLVSEQKTGGLGYTQDEEGVLNTAITKALDQKAPPCEALKIAVDLKYQPYSILKNIFSYQSKEGGADVDLNQMCMCATEKGVKTDILTQATKDANRLDEATQAQCFQDKGLGYTPEITQFEKIDPVDPPDPVSAESPLS